MDQVAVLGVADDRMGEVGKAFVVPESRAAFDTDEFLTWCKQKKLITR